MIRIGSDFSGVGAFEQALKRLDIPHRMVFACDIDSYARQTFRENYGEPDYFPEDVYKREIPEESLDIYMSSPPCQAFSLSGLRRGEEDDRGILFYNSHEFIQRNKPRYFIFENVKGLLSDNGGKTFQRWVDLLGGKSVNGTITMFPNERAVPYHIYYKVLNAKDFDIPQNRERVFIIGIRDDQDNHFRFPSSLPFKKTIQDVLDEDSPDFKWLTEEQVARIFRSSFNQETKRIHEINGISSSILARDYKDPKCVRIGAIRGRYNSDGYVEQVLEPRKDNLSNTITTVEKDNVVIIHNIYGGFKEQKVRIFKDYSPTIRTSKGGGHIPSVMRSDLNIRRLTPRECFRLMDFPDSFTWSCSDTQAYKQAGNSIVVGVLVQIIKQFSVNEQEN
jgi:DNA (cytosine-5)-methyltransferase 1